MNSLGIMARDRKRSARSTSREYFRLRLAGQRMRAMSMACSTTPCSSPRAAASGAIPGPGWHCPPRRRGLGHLRSKVWLGEMYANGAGVAEDHSKAIALFEQKQQPPMIRAASTISPSRLCRRAPGATRWYQAYRGPCSSAPAVSARADAYYHLGRPYEDGRTGATDSGKAAEYLIKALTNGSPKAVRDVNDRLQGWRSQTIGALQQMPPGAKICFSGPLDGSFSPTWRRAASYVVRGIAAAMAGIRLSIARRSATSAPGPGMAGPASPSLPARPRRSPSAWTRNARQARHLSTARAGVRRLARDAAGRRQGRHSRAGSLPDAWRRPWLRLFRPKLPPHTKIIEISL